ncbi:hypothetical protein MMC28_004480 [Mycoblastus sanguinarius]|nr:hypothetical protein [Mycoblastus sanguinarius]
MCFFLQLVCLASLAFAVPHDNANAKRQSCTSQEWNIQQFETFTVGNDPTSESPPFDFTHLSFYFDDPNFDTRASCGRSVAAGAGSLADGNSYPCDNGFMSFQYYGSSIELQQTNLDCGNVTYTASGGTGLSLECYPMFSGTSCETVTQVNVPVAFLQETK